VIENTKSESVSSYIKVKQLADELESRMLENMSKKIMKTISSKSFLLTKRVLALEIGASLQGALKKFLKKLKIVLI
jgi:hypothetical protein